MATNDMGRGFDPGCSDRLWETDVLRSLSLSCFLALALAMPSSAQQLLTLEDSLFEHVFLHLNLGPLHTSWRSVGSNRWEVETGAGSWVAFPPEGTDISYCHCGTGGTTVVLRVPRSRQEEVMAFAREVSGKVNPPLTERDLPPAKALQSGDYVLLDAFASQEVGPDFKWPQGSVGIEYSFIGFSNHAHIRLWVPLTRLDEAFAVIRRFRARPVQFF